MDEELKTYLDELKTYLDAKFAAVDARFAAVDEKFREVRAEIEKTETKLLRAFHWWARPKEIQIRHVVRESSGFEERLGLVEEHVEDIERRIVEGGAGK